jgi:Protein of unknown function (DUF3455)
MKNRNAPENQTTRRILLMACATALAVAFTVSLPQPAHADQVTPPPVPPIIQVPAGNKAFLEGHAVGTQNYICVPCPNPTTSMSMCPDVSGFAWILFTPQATLFKDNNKQVITHFFSPNPFENNTNPGVMADDMIRATWQDSRNTSTVWAKTNQSSSDPAFVKPGAIAWFLLEVVGAQDGPTGGHTLTATTFIQRLNTSGGIAPSTGCTLLTDVGAEAFVPYTADYFFYKKTAKSDADDGN